MLSLLLLALAEYLVFGAICWWGLNTFIDLVFPVLYFEALRRDLCRLRDLGFFLVFLGLAGLACLYFRHLFGSAPWLLTACTPVFLALGVTGLAALLALRFGARSHLLCPLPDLAKLARGMSRFTFFLLVAVVFFSVHVLLWQPLKDLYVLATFV